MNIGVMEQIGYYIARFAVVNLPPISISLVIINYAEPILDNAN